MFIFTGTINTETTLGKDSTFIKSTLQYALHIENSNGQTVNLSHHFYRICSSSIC